MLMAVSRAPLAKLAAYRQRMGWTFPWASSAGSDFNTDFNIWFTEAQQRDGDIEYNYRREQKLGWNRGQESGGQAAEDEIAAMRSEEHTSELQSLMRISYAVFCLKKKIITSCIITSMSTHYAEKYIEQHEL